MAQAVQGQAEARTSGVKGLGGSKNREGAACTPVKDSIRIVLCRECAKNSNNVSAECFSWCKSFSSMSEVITLQSKLLISFNHTPMGGYNLILYWVPEYPHIKQCSCVLGLLLRNARQSRCLRWLRRVDVFQGSALLGSGFRV